MLRIDFTDKYKIKRPDFAVRIVKHIQATYPKKPIKDSSIYNYIIQDLNSFNIEGRSQIVIRHHTGRFMWVDV